MPRRGWRRPADQPESGRIDVAELAHRGEEAGSDQQAAAAERVGQCSGGHLGHQHADVKRSLDQTELGQRQPAREQVHGPHRAGEDDAVEELVEPEDCQRARVHETPRVIGKPDWSAERHADVGRTTPWYPASSVRDARDAEAQPADHRCGELDVGAAVGHRRAGYQRYGSRSPRVRPELICRNREQVIDMVGRGLVECRVEAIELIAAGDHVVMTVRGAGIGPPVDDEG
jgi:hypothetical protein